MKSLVVVANWYCSGLESPRGSAVVPSRSFWKRCASNVYHYRSESAQIFVGNRKYPLRDSRRALDPGGSRPLATRSDHRHAVECRRSESVTFRRNGRNVLQVQQASVRIQIIMRDMRSAGLHRLPGLNLCDSFMKLSRSFSSNSARLVQTPPCVSSTLCISSRSSGISSGRATKS